MFMGWFPHPQFPIYKLRCRAPRLPDMGRSILGTTCSHFDMGLLFTVPSWQPWIVEVLFLICAANPLFFSALLSLCVCGHTLPLASLSLSSFPCWISQGKNFGVSGSFLTLLLVSWRLTRTPDRKASLSLLTREWCGMTTRFWEFLLTNPFLLFQTFSLEPLIGPCWPTQHGHSFGDVQLRRKSTWSLAPCIVSRVFDFQIGFHCLILGV